jgi:hypothetical protein
MGCGCGSSGSTLGNYTIKDKDGATVKTLAAVTETEAKAFAAKTPGSTWSKSS